MSATAPPPYGQPPPNYQPQPAAYPSAPGYPPAYPPQPQPGYGGTYQPVPASHHTSNTTAVIVQPTANHVHVVESRPPNYVGLSIFTLLCCCWVFGIIALIYSLQVDSAYTSGDSASAHAASRSAKTWNIVGIIWGVVTLVIVNIIWIPIVASANIAAANNNYDNNY